MVQPWSPTDSMHPLPSVAAVIKAGAGDLPRQQIEEAMSELILAWRCGDRYPITARVPSGARPAARFMSWLEQHPGDTWAQRWGASGGEAAGRDWPALAGATTRITAVELRYAENAAIVMRLLQPSHAFYRSLKRRRLPHDWIKYHDVEHYQAYLASTRTAPDPNVRRRNHRLLVELSIVSGHALEDVTSEDFQSMTAYLREHVPTENLLSMWHHLKGIGLLKEQPDELAQLVATGRETPAAMVARYNVQPAPIRDLFIAYLHERQAGGADYATLRNVSIFLCTHFWTDIKAHHPEQDNLRLSAEQAAAWMTRLATKPDGSTRRNYASILGCVRGFYLDLAALAHDDPATWAPWAQMCPIPAKMVRTTYAGERAKLNNRMQERTRTLAEHVPAFVDSVTRHHRRAAALLAACQAAEPGEPFVHDGETWKRTPKPRDGFVMPLLHATDPMGRRVNLVGEEHRAFWTLASLEVLRHTGLRCSEMLTLTHLSIQPFRKPTGEVLPLLQIAPSKTDMERVIPVGPELAHVLGAIVRRTATVNGAIPLVRRHNAHQKTISEEMPFLFQYQHLNGRRQVLGTCTVRGYFDQAADRADLRHRNGDLVRFTPHDFRRLFATEAIRYGMPIHIAAQLLGHKDLNTTRGYTAIYPTEVFKQYGDHLTRRRAERPSDEYRQPTAAEISEFAEHFGRRRVELGNCVRPYGSGCSHEHACIRCDFLQVTKAGAPRLDVIEEDLNRRVEDAKTHTWLGDVEQLQVTLTRLRTKRSTYNEQPVDEDNLPLPRLPIALADSPLMAVKER